MQEGRLTSQEGGSRSSTDNHGEKRHLENQGNPEAKRVHGQEQGGIGGGEKRKRDNTGEDEEGEDKEMQEISLVGLSDMCAPEVTDIMEYHNEHEFYDETSGEVLDPLLVAQACQEELKRFEHMKVYKYVRRSEVPRDNKLINVKWVHVNKGTAGNHIIRCRLV